MASMEAYPMPERLARAHAWARRQPWLGRFTLMNRLLLAMAFLPTGLVKATGQRFTTLPIENPVGFFFEAMFQTGPFWHFIGVTQMAAAILLLIPATATLGAVLFLPIGLSIFLITWGVGFQGTVYITFGMLLSVIYLICWDGDRIWAGASILLGRRDAGGLLGGAGLLEKAGWLCGGLSGVGLFTVVRGFLPSTWMRGLLIAGVVSLLMVIVGGAVTLFRPGRPKEDL
jgi:hypothetical protein